LAVIQGYIELLKMDIPPGEKVQNRLRATEKAISQAAELTNRLLVFSKGGEPVKQVLDVSDLIKDAVLRILGASPVEKRFHLDRDLWPVEVDERQIHQVIRNLAINAAEAMPEGGRLAIRAENTMVKVQDKLPIRPGAYIRISVEDTGKGIPTDELPLIFDPYFSTKQRGAQKGMGLGLSVCHSVVTKHNGCITLESQEGRGSTFRVYLPATVSVALPPDERPPEGLPGAKGRILVMDDEAMIRDMLKELLTAMGYEVETTSDGLAAIDLYIRATESQRPYRMVILDLMVPGGLGGEPTMERLRAIDPGVRGIILSGYSDDPVIQDYAQYGFVEALKKPFSMKALQDVLEKHP
jgi:CheY-like chemotaxis protein